MSAENRPPSHLPSHLPPHPPSHLPSHLPPLHANPPVPTFDFAPRTEQDDRTNTCTDGKWHTITAMPVLSQFPLVSVEMLAWRDFHHGLPASTAPNDIIAAIVPPLLAPHHATDSTEQIAAAAAAAQLLPPTGWLNTWLTLPPTPATPTPHQAHHPDRAEPTPVPGDTADQPDAAS